MTIVSGNRLLGQLARAHGAQRAYYDVEGHRQAASAESLLAALRALGVPVSGVKDAPSALRQHRQESWRRVIEPVVVAWDGGPAAVDIRLPASAGDVPLDGHLVLESGEERGWRWDGAEGVVVAFEEVEGSQYVIRRAKLPGGLPCGYHKLRVEAPQVEGEALVIAAPLKAFTPQRLATGKAWGVFLPLYALHAARSWGAADLSDLGALMDWVEGQGGSLVGTLPLLATFLEEPFDPSPYAPVSRRVWSEFYVDVAAAPELERCPAARAVLESSAFRGEVETLRGAPLVDYRRQMALKRRVLEELAQFLFSEGGPRREALERYAREHPLMDDHARFRATMERRRGEPWRSWPQSLREGALGEGDYDEGVRRYHLYAHWLAAHQVDALAGKARANGVSLYLDLPLGVHPDGYDTWREQGAFVHEVSVGAPPDAVFTQGQDWGFPPLHPEAQRRRGYRYFVSCLRHHLRHAGALRLDHVMGLHRLFWIPQGMEPGQGVYVRNRSEELYAVIALESHRHRAMVVGEDLGTVPSYVRPAMARHGLHRMHVVQYDLVSDPRRALSRCPTSAVASVNTHDMPPFAAFWRGADIEERREMGLLDGRGARRERSRRQAQKRALASFLRRRGFAGGPDPSLEEVLRGTLDFLGTCPASVVLMNLEDLWLETEPQNVPGTGAERPNWRRRARFALEEFTRMPRVVDAIRELRQWRQDRRGQ